MKLCLALAISLTAAAQISEREALKQIRSDSLRGHVSFLASDLLEGRATPSRGLDLAAEYIAAQFRRAGLEPAGDDGYFQTANWLLVEPNFDSFLFTIEVAGKSIDMPASSVRIQNPAKVDFERLEAVKVSQNGLPPNEISVSLVDGKVVFVERGPADWSAAVARRLRSLDPALVVYIDDRSATPPLIDPEASRPAGKMRVFISEMPEIDAGTRVSIHLGVPIERPVRLRNVAGLLRGSDPTLWDEYVLVSAHYDHLGVRSQTESDPIFNGANDDASGTAAVLELAAVLGSTSPKRSIVFGAFFGEERGFLGSRYYVRRPLFPLEKTVANLNLEHLGRTDDTDGPKHGSATLTGFAFSDVGQTLADAAKPWEVRIDGDEKYGDAFFRRSDNLSLAEAGVPAHTLCVALDFPDYHRTGDHWDKLDYANMEKIVRAVGAGVLALANAATAPHWNEKAEKAAPYLEAWRKRHRAGVE